MKKPMTRYMVFLGFFAFTTAFYPLCAIAQESLVPVNSVVYSRSNLLLFIQRWHYKDGAEGKVISDYFCEFLMERPSVFFDIMEANPSCYDEWLKELPKLSFTDYGGCINPECIRSGMLKTLTITQLAPSQEPMKMRLLTLLKSTRIQRVE